MNKTLITVYSPHSSRPIGTRVPSCEMWNVINNFEACVWLTSNYQWSMQLQFTQLGSNPFKFYQPQPMSYISISIHRIWNRKTQLNKIQLCEWEVKQSCRVWYSICCLTLNGYEFMDVKQKKNISKSLMKPLPDELMIWF